MKTYLTALVVLCLALAGSRANKTQTAYDRSSDGTSSQSIDRYWLGQQSGSAARQQCVQVEATRRILSTVSHNHRRRRSVVLTKSKRLQDGQGHGVWPRSGCVLQLRRNRTRNHHGWP